MDFVFSIPIILIFLLALAFISFFFSASETAIIGLSKLRLRHMVAKGIKHAESIQRLMTKLDKFIAAILIGNDFVNIAISSIITAIFVHIFGYHWGVIIATFTATSFVLIMCEITPKLLAIKHTEKVALFSSPIMEIFIRIFHPVICIFTGTSNFILKLLGVEASKRSPLITEEELRLMIEIGKEEGVLSDEEKKMLYRIFEFGDIKVSEVMLSKEKIIGLNLNSTPEQVLNIFVEKGHARLPVYEGSIDNIMGVVYARDLLYMLRDKGLFVLQDLVQPAYYVAGTLRVNELLRKFQLDKIQIAIIVDGHNKTQGLVTLEDLIEEIVGEIEEKHTMCAP
ncbi:MAG: hemolysin family protein [Candidatus Omnitrophica bacterium]|nr:hemolysin family protein [Candidatus Omnitrophota bacterium]MBU4473027.1 hemolysin family protein [Candidatus Omnitrophota bacterium]MCG2706265.1 hemolysin family protein [Candidatus Omnitrophota bacterium]